MIRDLVLDAQRDGILSNWWEFFFLFYSPTIVTKNVQDPTLLDGSTNS